ncbi:hypothetical protein HMPREF9372_2165 [Sporosarcina newyorkensis 2681]|uniref:Uncharacterized protein n=1 Tax=Sporosarcina newyorkensis 2681 TaxID=1027292 RepID=F9DTN4_9BACL|nr:hypothetical protein [Sporosarcina newyorkensis]EGQ25547.1 hypothetical protein HMPREF9372_2165 [Sporosarcina newyorkensis 2681]
MLGGKDETADKPVDEDEKVESEDNMQSNLPMKMSQEIKLMKRKGQLSII